MTSSTKKIDLKWISKKMFTGTLSKWAVKQSPHSCPDNLERVVIKADGAWPITGDKFKDNELINEWTREDFEDFVHKFVFSTAETLSWNTPMSGRQGNAFVSAFGPMQAPEDDFVDLDALVRNVVSDCWNQD
jgi:hypothetical protein